MMQTPPCDREKKLMVSSECSALGSENPKKSATPLCAGLEREAICVPVSRTPATRRLHPPYSGFRVEGFVILARRYGAVEVSAGSSVQTMCTCAHCDYDIAILQQHRKTCTTINNWSIIQPQSSPLEVAATKASLQRGFHRRVLQRIQPRGLQRLRA